MPWYQTLNLILLPIIALVGLPAALYTNYSLRLRLEHQAKRLLDLHDKLPDRTVGLGQIERALRETTLNLAFTIEHPRRKREGATLLVVGLSSLALMVLNIVWFYFVEGENTWFSPAAGALSNVTFYVFLVLYSNSVAINFLTRSLFVSLNAPSGLVRPKPRLWRLSRQPALSDVLEYAADIRDRTTDRSMTTVESVNAGLVAARSDLHRLISERRRLKRQVRILALTQRVIAVVVLSVLIIPAFLARRRIRRIERDDPALGAQLSARYDREVRPAFRAGVASLRGRPLPAGFGEVPGPVITTLDSGHSSIWSRGLGLAQRIADRGSRGAAPHGDGIAAD